MQENTLQQIDHFIISLSLFILKLYALVQQFQFFLYLFNTDMNVVCVVAEHSL